MPGSPEYDIPGFIYASLVAAGGIMGFVKKGSVASLIAGGGSGVLAGWGAYVRAVGVFLLTIARVLQPQGCPCLVG